MVHPISCMHERNAILRDVLILSSCCYLATCTIYAGGKSSTLFALTCKGIYIDVDVRHALANIRGIAAMSTVARNASVAIHQLEMCPDDLSDLCETDAAYILVHTGDSGSLPEPPDGTYDTPEMQLLVQMAHGRKSRARRVDSRVPGVEWWLRCDQV